MAPNPPRFVPDRPLGGAVSLDSLLGPEGSSVTTSSEPEERVWLDVPPEYELPPAHLDDAVSEVNYINNVLKMTLLPTPLPDDDLQFCSDVLLSLETRKDITARVLMYAPVYKTLPHIRHTVPGDDESFDIVRRAKALSKHWKQLKQQFRDTFDEWDSTADLAYPPLVTSMPDGKPTSWKLQLDEQRVEEARKLHSYFKSKRLHALSYFRDHRPTPMAWVPADGAAWKETARDKIESGDLYHSKRWSPLYGGLDVQHVPLSWKDPDADEATLEKREEDRAFYYDSWLDKIRDMRVRREEWKKSQQS